MNYKTLLEKGIEALRKGRKEEARTIFDQVLQDNPNSEAAWLWMSGAVSTDEERSTCLENVLVINPHNMAAKKGLDRLLKNTSVRPLNSIPERTDISNLQDDTIQSTEFDQIQTDQSKKAKSKTPSKISSNRKRREVIILLGLVIILIAIFSGAAFIVWQTMGNDILAVVKESTPTKNSLVLIPTELSDPNFTIQPTILSSPFPATNKTITLHTDLPSTSDPRLFALSGNDLPYGFNLVSTKTGYNSNQSVADGKKEPEIVLQNLLSWGRVIGYYSFFNQAGANPQEIYSQSILMQNSKGAQEYFTDIHNNMLISGWRLLDSPNIGEETRAYSKLLTDSRNSNIQWNLYEIFFRKRNVISSVFGSGHEGSINLSSVVELAKLMDSRIVENPPDDNLALLPNITPFVEPTTTPLPTETPPPTQIIIEQTKTLGPIWNTTRDESYSLNITVHNVQYSFGEDYDTPKQGNIYVIVQLTIKNLGPNPVRSIGPYDFQVKDANGALRDYDYFGETKECRLELVDLSENGSISGCVGFEVPDTGKLELIYAPYKYEGLKEGRYLSFTIR